jgi:RNA polymerase sigma factor (sigma-70 family)
MSAATVPQLQRLFARAERDTEPDRDLLDRFHRTRDGAAFAALVERHGPMVLGVCRRTLGNAADADDAFQATFLTLARRSGSLARPDALAGWLYGTAFRLALNARRAARRRAVEPYRPSAPTRDPLDELTAREFLAILDAEIARLSERDRCALVLCGVEGLSLDEAAARLGVTRDAVKGRLERSRLRLRRNLAQRGVAVALAAGLAIVPSPSVAAPLLRATIELIRPGAAVSPAIAALANAAGPAWVRVVRIAAIAVIALGMIGLGSTLALRAAPQPPAAPPNKPPAERLPPGVVARLGVPRLPLGAPLAFAPDGRTFVGVSGDTVIRFDATTGKEIERTQFPESFSNAHFSADGQTLLNRGQKETTVWDVATGRQLLTIPMVGKSFAVALFPDGKSLALVGYNSDPKPGYRLSVWHVATRTERVLGATAARGDYLVFSPDGKRLLLWQVGLPVSCWDIARGQVEWTTKDRSDKNLFAPDGRTVFRFAPTPGWSALDAATGKPVQGFKLPSDYPYSEALAAPDNRTYILPTKRGVIFWDMKDGRELRLLPDTERDTSWGARFVGPFAPDGKSFLTNFGALQRYDLATGKPLLPDTTGLGHTTPPGTFAFSPDGKWLASGASFDYTVRIWEVATGRIAHTLRGHSSYIRTVAFTPDGRRLVSGSGDSTVRVWDVATGTVIHVLRLHDGRNQDEHQQVATLRISPDGRRVMVTATEGFNGDDSPAVLSVWDIIDGKRLDQRRNVYGKGIDTVVKRPLTAEGAMLLENGRLMDAAGAAVRPDPLLGPGERLGFGGPTITADGHLAAGPVERRADRSGVNAVLVWEVATGRPVVRLPITVTQPLAFDPTGTTLVAISQSVVQTWNLRTGRAVRTHSAQVLADRTFTFALAVSSDGRTAATGSSDATILLWDVAPPKVPTDPLSAADCAAAWADLADADAAKGFAAVCRLTDGPTQSLPFLKELLRPIAPPPAGEVKALLNDLGSPQFKTRDAAEKALRAHGDRVEPLLRDALKANSPAEAKKRIDAILAGFSNAAPPQGEALRGVRAVWALERIGTPDARRLLADLVTGVESARLTREAKAALDRSQK